MQEIQNIQQQQQKLLKLISDYNKFAEYKINI